MRNNNIIKSSEIATLWNRPMTGLTSVASYFMVTPFSVDKPSINDTIDYTKSLRLKDLKSKIINVAITLPSLGKFISISPLKCKKQTYRLRKQQKKSREIVQ